MFAFWYNQRQIFLQHLVERQPYRDRRARQLRAGDKLTDLIRNIGLGPGDPAEGEDIAGTIGIDLDNVRSNRDNNQVGIDPDQAPDRSRQHRHEARCKVAVSR